MLTGFILLVFLTSEEYQWCASLVLFTFSLFHFLFCMLNSISTVHTKVRICAFLLKALMISVFSSMFSAFVSLLIFTCTFAEGLGR